MPTSTRGDRARFVLWGDSITQQGFSSPGDGSGGWCARLADAYARSADVVLRGYSGYNTEWARTVLLPHVFALEGDGGAKQRKKASLVTVFFGANDAALPDGSAEKQHVPLERFRSNLSALIEASVEATTTEGSGGLVVVVTPPPVDEAARVRHALHLARQGSSADASEGGEGRVGRAGEFGEGAPSLGGGGDPLLLLPERTDAAARRYAAAAVAAAVESRERARVGRGSACPAASARVEVLDLYKIFKESSPTPWPELLSDGLHLSARGNELLYSSLMSLVAERAPHLLPENLPRDFPDRSVLEPCPR